ncbi:hypothetical protein RIF29_27639 [Crotalaria pallida]|uniref:Uncharacterized protein n=1 Tax=Crotalaria pallida TaxID=3830 RepID=A0AAN9EUB1_CROPI
MILLWRPYALTRHFRNQGVMGPPYSIVSGSLHEIKAMVKNKREKVLDVAVIFTCVSSLVLLFAVTGSVSVDQSLWVTEVVPCAGGGDYWEEIGAVLSTVGHFEAQLSSSAYQVLGNGYGRDWDFA